MGFGFNSLERLTTQYEKPRLIRITCMERLSAKSISMLSVLLSHHIPNSIQGRPDSGLTLQPLVRLSPTDGGDPAIRFRNTSREATWSTGHLSSSQILSLGRSSLRNWPRRNPSITLAAVITYVVQAPDASANIRYRTRHFQLQNPGYNFPFLS